MLDRQYSVLAEYLSYIQDTLGVQIFIKDLKGFIRADKNLHRTLFPFSAHTNPFCMYVKSKQHLWDKCMAMQLRLAEKCTQDKPISYGICYAGVEEYTLPLFFNDSLIGILHVGVFRSNHRIGAYLMDRLTRESGLCKSELAEKYMQLLPTAPAKHQVEALLKIATEFLASIYGNILRCNPKLDSRAFNSQEEYQVQRILSYIYNHYREGVSVRQIAIELRCSESVINHLFKRTMGENIKGYVNLIRIQEAKSMLQDPAIPIYEIAANIGFEDPNYFSRVFSHLVGESPSSYRKRILSKDNL